MTWAARLALLHVTLALLLFGAVFATAAFAGWQYGSRDKVCMVMETAAGVVPVCDYGFRPPEEVFVQ